MRQDNVAYARDYIKANMVRPLGWHQARGSEVRYAFWTEKNPLLVFRPTQLIGEAALLGLLPEIEVWALAFPSKGRRRCDVHAAAAWLIRGCLNKGRIELPPELAPRPAGRPPKVRAA
jgi:hypothetical protein